MERTLCNVWNWSSDSESESTVLSVTERRGREKSDLAKETDSGESVETQEEKQVSAKRLVSRVDATWIEISAAQTKNATTRTTTAIWGTSNVCMYNTCVCTCYSFYGS